MAEYVHQNLEDMLPELEEMESTGVFTREEIRSIIKQRTDFEYRLQRRIVQKEDFLKYMQYELNMDQLRKRRKLKLGLKKPTEGEHLAVKRLHYVFQKALKKFRGDVKMWLQYIDFCKHMGSTKILGKIYARVLQFHPHNAKFWIMAAKWEFEENNSVPAARTLLQRGLRANSDSNQLWLEYFRMELLHLDKIRKRRQVLGVAGIEAQKDDSISSEFLAGKTAEIVYNKAIKHIPDDLEFRLSFLQVYKLFPGTTVNQDKVYESLLRDFPRSEGSWNVLACRPIEDLKRSVDEKTPLITDLQWVEVEQQRDKIFTKAVQKVPTVKMWEYYIKAHIELLDASSASQVERRVKCVLELFLAAEKEGMLSELMYREWVIVLKHIGETSKSLSVYERAIQKYSNSVVLWEEFLKVKLLLQGAGDDDNIEKIFSRALEAVNAKDSLPLWQLWTNYCITYDPEQVQSIFEKALNSCNEVAAVMKECYIDWIAVFKGIKAARNLYTRLSQVKPVTLPFFKKCLDIEQAQMKPSAKHLRKLYDMGLEQFGDREPDLWLDYIRFERSHPGGIPENVAKLHWRAMKTLRSECTSQFVTSYSLLQAGNI